MPSVAEVLIQMGVPERLARAARGPIGVGTEGVVYAISETRILKVNVKAPKTQSLRSFTTRARRYGWAASIYDEGRLTPRGFWYTSERLLPLPQWQRRVLDTIGYALMGHAKGAIPKATADHVFARELANLPGPLRAVVRKARAAGYHDLHGGNIMQTTRGTFKVIDLESFRPVGRARAPRSGARGRAGP